MAGDGKNEIRGMGGADDLTGGQDRDVFAWKASDLLDASGKHRGVDTIHLFENNDGLDISNILRDVVYDNLNDLVLLTDTVDGTLLQVKINDRFVDVALLADVHTGGATAAAWASDGLILA
jgi:Ca2+-binding RTX toxin-like protein